MARVSGQAKLRVSRKPIFIDAFAGCGGLSLGLMRAGWAGLFAIEKDRFAFDTIKANFLAPKSRFSYSWPRWLQKRAWCIEDLLRSHSSQLMQLRGRVTLLAGGPPCQGFSSAGRRRANDPRNLLVERYLDLVGLVRPKIVLMENVLGITYDFKTSRGKKPLQNFAETIKRRLGAEYEVHSSAIRASRFGVPQARPRFILVAVLKEHAQAADVHLFFKTLRAERTPFLKRRGIPARVTSRMAISDLEVDRNGTKACEDSEGYEATAYSGPLNAYQRAMRDGFKGAPSDTRLAKHRPKIKQRFKKIIALCKQQKRLNVQLSPVMRKKFGINKMATRVLDPAKPAPTITSMPDDLLHYREPRTLSVRENARLQTFPDWFVFRGKYTTGGDLRRKEVPRFTQVANAVPPLLAELLGITLARLFAENRVRSVRSIRSQGPRRSP